VDVVDEGGFVDGVKVARKCSKVSLSSPSSTPR
jgi:hypothetical protein